MSRYNSLWKYIQENGSSSFKMIPAEIQNITGTPIDHSFLKYKKEPTEYGYEVGKIFMKEQMVIPNRVNWQSPIYQNTTSINAFKACEVFQMTKGAIINKGEDRYTSFKKIFKTLNNFQKDYNRLTTDCEACPEKWGHEERIHQSKHGKYAWISGEELTGITNKDDFQWVRVVLSGVDKSCSKDDILKYELPYAGGYGGFWKETLSIQHPLASIGLVVWDGYLTLFTSKDEDTVNCSKKSFPLSRDLEEYNATFRANESDDTNLYYKWLQERT